MEPDLDRRSLQWGQYCNLVAEILYYRHFHHLYNTVDAKQLPTLSELYESQMITKPVYDSIHRRCDSLQELASALTSYCLVK